MIPYTTSLTVKDNFFLTNRITDPVKKAKKNKRKGIPKKLPTAPKLKLDLIKIIFKKEEILTMKKEGETWETRKKVSRSQDEALRQAGISKPIARLIDSVGGEPLGEVQEILQQDTLSLQDPKRLKGVLNPIERVQKGMQLHRQDWFRRF